MGYNIHIHRREDWADKGDPITLEEWIGLIAADGSLVIDGSAEWADSETGANISTPTAEWAGPNGVKGYFWWYDGNIEAKNPEPAVIVKAHRLASELGARVQGDDGEFYDADGKSYYCEPGDNELPIEPEAPIRSGPNWFQRLFKK